VVDFEINKETTVVEHPSSRTSLLQDKKLTTWQANKVNIIKIKISVGMKTNKKGFTHTLNLISNKFNASFFVHCLIN